LHNISQRYARLRLIPKGRVKRANAEHCALYELWAGGKAREARKLLQGHSEVMRDELKELGPHVLASAPPDTLTPTEMRKSSIKSPHWRQKLRW
jgi:hypothetical protein